MIGPSRRWSGEWGGPDAPTTPLIDVLIPTVGRETELAVTLAGLAAQDDPPFAVIVSDQSDEGSAATTPAVTAMRRVLRAQGREVRMLRHRPRRGIAEHRQFLLEQASAEYVLFLDDDVWLEPGTLARMHDAITSLGCGFVGSAVQGLSYLGDHRPAEEEAFEPWDGPVVPETPAGSDRTLARSRLHNAANLAHIAARLGIERGGWRAYRVAWVGACALYRRHALIACGGFEFWGELPSSHAGEDVVAEWRVMERFGGAGIVPSGAVHLESPTTIPDRTADAPDILYSGWR